jgi:hypothetical protein
MLLRSRGVVAVPGAVFRFRSAICPAAIESDVTMRLLRTPLLSRALPSRSRALRSWTMAASVAAAGIAISAAGATPARAAAIEAEYAISLLGIQVGTANLSGTIDSRRYDIALQARMTGLAGILTGGKGAGTAAGAIAGVRPQPRSFAVNSESGSEQRTVRMAIAGNAVQAVAIEPPLDDKPDRVPLTDAHKRGVVDPLGALVMPVAGAFSMTDPASCNRTIPVFDGAARFDVVLTHAGVKQIDTAGYRGPVAVCKARYVPVAGHRTLRKSTKFMAENRDLEAWLAPVSGTRVLMPYRISIRTMLGTTVLTASRFSVDGSVVARVNLPPETVGSLATVREADLDEPRVDTAVR